VNTLIRGQYQPLERLGAGGMGEVLKARDLKLNRLVALKVLRQDQSGNADRRRRFMQEAQAASALSHPNIITIYDVVSADDGAEVMVMELVAGKALDALIPQTGMAVAQVLTCAEQIADALATAHRAGIIHRDLKPGNIMVTERGLVKLLDFGLAKFALEADGDATTMATLTVQGTIVGTLAYMSPEQAQGQPVDARTDMFSLGAVLYEMATGRRAFHGDNAISTLTSVLRDEPRRVLEISPAVPAVLSDVIHRCLQKDPAQRFQSMGEVHEALARLRQQADSGTLAVPPVPPATPPASSAGSNAPAWLWPAVGAAVVVIAAGAWWMTRAAEPAAPPPDAPAQMAVAQSSAMNALPPPPVPQPQGPAVGEPTPPFPPRGRGRGPQPGRNGGPMRDGGPRADVGSSPAQGLAPIPVPEAWPVPLVLSQALPADAVPGHPVRLEVAADVVIDGVVVIARGAPAAGTVHATPRRSRAAVRLESVRAVDGSELTLRATAGRAANANRPIDLPAGTSTIGYVAVPQTVRVKR
jgi:serine/threonine-protein kinase